MKQIFVTALLALLLAPLARAGAPVQNTVLWDRTRVIAASDATCPFPIQVHSVGTIHTWTYDDGTQRRSCRTSRSSGRTWIPAPSRPRPSRGRRSSIRTERSS